MHGSCFFGKSVAPPLSQEWRSYAKIVGKVRRRGRCEVAVQVVLYSALKQLSRQFSQQL
jgi:hypothetical protein